CRHLAACFFVNSASERCSSKSSMLQNALSARLRWVRPTVRSGCSPLSIPQAICPAEKCTHRNPEQLCDLEQPSAANAIGTVLIPLHLLKGDTNVSAQFHLGEVTI